MRLLTQLCYDLKTVSASFVNEYILLFSSLNQLHMFSFTDLLSLLGSSTGTELSL